MSGEASINVGFIIVDRSIHHLRLLIHGFVQLATQDVGLAGRATVTCAELVECLTRKLAWKACTLRLELSHERPARVEVSIEASAPEIDAIEDALEAGNRDAPLTAYTQALSNAARSDGDALLGFARVRYEGRMTLQGRRQGGKYTVIADAVESGAPNS